MFEMYLSFKQIVSDMIVFVIDAIKEPNYVQNKKNVNVKIASLFEYIINKYEGKKIHKLTIVLMLKSIGEILMELEDFDLAIKEFKALKNYCRKWFTEIRIQKKIYQHRYENKYGKGCGNFEKHYLSSLEQIGYIYRHVGMYKSAADYFKKQLTNSWYFNDRGNETRSY